MLTAKEKLMQLLSLDCWEIIMREGSAVAQKI